IVGTSLRRAHVALAGLCDGAPLVAHLAACGVGRWLWATDERPTSIYGASPRLAESISAYLGAQHGAALDLNVTKLPLAEWIAAIRSDPPDLVIVIGRSAKHWMAFEAAVALRAPALLIRPPTDRSPCQVITVFPS